jgi:hypothetical protein
MDKISRAEAFERVGQAMFGLDRIGRLRGQEQYLLDVGPQGSPQPTAILQVNEVMQAERRANAMRHQHTAVNAWLKGHRFHGRQCSRARFEKVHAAEFPARMLPRATTPMASERAASGTRASLRSRPQRERAERALKAIYPTGIPDQTSEPNKILYKKVNQWLKASGLPEVQNDSILRAAGRR